MRHHHEELIAAPAIVGAIVWIWAQVRKAGTR